MHSPYCHWSTIRVSKHWLSIYDILWLGNRIVASLPIPNLTKARNTSFSVLFEFLDVLNYINKVPNDVIHILIRQLGVQREGNFILE